MLGRQALNIDPGASMISSKWPSDASPSPQRDPMNESQPTIYNNSNAGGSPQKKKRIRLGGKKSNIRALKNINPVR